MTASTDVQDISADSPAMVTFFIDPYAVQGKEGFIRMDKYSVNVPTGPLTWIEEGRMILSVKDGGRVGKRCLIGIAAIQPDLKLSCVISFYGEPGSGIALPQSPFDKPNPHHVAEVLNRKQMLMMEDGKEQVVYFYPIMFTGDPVDMSGEPFAREGNYFYTVCVRNLADGKFYIWDPKLEIGP